MVLGAHIALALLSISTVTFAAFHPSRIKLVVAGLLMLGTALSGVALIILGPINLGKTCLSGLVYLGYMSVAFSSIHKKLALDRRISLVDNSNLLP